MVAIASVTSYSSAFAIDEVVNLSIQNMNIYYDGYNSATNKITGIQFAVGAELKSNSQNTSVPFSIILMLLPEGTTDVNEGVKVWTKNIQGGTLKQGGTLEYDDLIIDLSTISGIQTGRYRLIAYVEGYTQLGAYFDETDYISLTAGPQADLKIRSVNYDFDQTNGILSNVVITVNNAGTANAGISDIKFKFTTMFEDMVVTDSVTYTLPGVSSDSDLRFVPEDLSITDITGDYMENLTFEMVVTLDPLKKIAESSEINNSMLIRDISNLTGIANPISELGIFIPNPVSKNYLSDISKKNEITGIDVYSIEGTKLSIGSAKQGINLVEIKTIKGSERIKLFIE